MTIIDLYSIHLPFEIITVSFQAMHARLNAATACQLLTNFMEK